MQLKCSEGQVLSIEQLQTSEQTDVWFMSGWCASGACGECIDLRVSYIYAI